jgi:hypothetical protein
MTHRRKPRRIETEADRAEIMHAREVKRAEKERKAKEQEDENGNR